MKVLAGISLIVIAGILLYLGCGLIAWIHKGERKPGGE